MGGERIKESEGVKDSKEIPNFIEVQDFIFFPHFFLHFGLVQRPSPTAW
jgi:hypothetical protein